MGFYKMPKTSQRFIEDNRRQEYAKKLLQLKNNNISEFEEEIEMLPNIVRQSQLTIPMSGISENAYNILKSEGLNDEDMLLGPDDLRDKIKQASGKKRKDLNIINEHINDQKKDIIPNIINAKSTEEIESCLKYCVYAYWTTHEESNSIKNFRKNNSESGIYTESIFTSCNIKIKNL